MVEVVVAALVRNGRVLLGHRSPDKHVYPDIWDLPGGVVEAGESELCALAREMREELGVQIAPQTAQLGWFGLDDVPPLAHAQVRASLLDAVERGA